MQLTVTYDFLPKRPSTHAAVVMDHFGIGFETGRHVIAEDLELPIEPGDVVCFTGPSGSGKSSLMRAAAEQLCTGQGVGSTIFRNWPSTVVAKALPSDQPIPKNRRPDPELPRDVLNIDALELGDRILVDALDRPVHESLALLSTCGLGEAQLLLRTPSELSDGQRYRFRLALALARTPAWIVADEFTATLDRTLAKVVAFNIRRVADRTGAGFLLATTHEDILDDLQPSLHVRCRLDGRVEWTRGSAKKKDSASPTRCGSVAAPRATGRTSLGGIIEVTTSASCGS